MMKYPPTREHLPGGEAFFYVLLERRFRKASRPAPKERKRERTGEEEYYSIFLPLHMPHKLLHSPHAFIYLYISPSLCLVF